MHLKIKTRKSLFPVVVANKNLLIPIFLLVCLFFHFTVQAQNRSDLNKKLNQTIVFKNGTLTLDSLTRLVHKNTRIRFSFNSVKVTGTTPIYFSAGSYTVQQLLMQIKKTTTLYYDFYNGYIIWSDNPPKPASKTATVKNKVNASRGNASKKQKNIVVKTNTVKKDTASNIVTAKINSTVIKAVDNKPDSISNSGHSSHITYADTIVAKAAQPTHSDSVMNDSVAAANNKFLTPMPSAPAINKTGSPTIRNRITINANWEKLYLQTGFFATDVLYSNLSVEAGINSAHIVVTVGTNYKLNSWGIGVGSVFHQTPTAQWRAFATINFVKRNRHFSDSISESEVKITGKFLSTGVIWGKRIGNSNWGYRFGATFNVMKTNYYNNDVLTKVSALPGSLNKNEDQLKLLHPPLLLSNNFSLDKSDNIKTWIGFTASIYFNLKNH